MKLLFLCLIGSCAIIAAQKNIEKRVMTYFDSENVKSFYEVWKKYRLPMERALEQMLKETYGEKGMNVYIRKTWNTFKLANGFFMSDNMVDVLFTDMYLSKMPHLRAPEVSFALASNVLRIAASVSKMFVEADYLLFRNLSDVVYTSSPFDPYKISPFSLPQVKNEGEVTIVAEGCYLSGYAVAKLGGHSVNLGHDTFRLMNCKFSVEISTPGTGAPPVIAPYFSPEQGTELELLLIKSIREELVPKLQGAMFTFVNTSALLGSQLPKLRHDQQTIFKRTSSFMSKVVTHLNKLSREQNGGIAHLEDKTISWIDKYDGEMLNTKVTIGNVTLSGLDSAYSAQTGGPYKMPEMTIDDNVRFAAIQVRGSIILFSDGKLKNKFVFYGEIHDASFYTSITTDMLQQSSTKNKDWCRFIGWRHLDLHTPTLALIAPNSLITGYLLNELPLYMIQQMSKYIWDAVVEADRNEEGKDESYGEAKDNNENEEDRDNENNNYNSDRDVGSDIGKGSGKLLDKPLINEPILGDSRSQDDGILAHNEGVLTQSDVNPENDENHESENEENNNDFNEHENLDHAQNNDPEGSDGVAFDEGDNKNMDEPNRMINEPMLVSSEAQDDVGSYENNERADQVDNPVEENSSNNVVEGEHEESTNYQHIDSDNSNSATLDSGDGKNVNNEPDRMFNEPMLGSNEANDDVNYNQNDKNGEEAHDLSSEGNSADGKYEKAPEDEDNKHNNNGYLSEENNADKKYQSAHDDFINNPEDGGDVAFDTADSKNEDEPDRMINEPMLSELRTKLKNDIPQNKTSNIRKDDTNINKAKDSEGQKLRNGGGEDGQHSNKTGNFKTNRPIPLRKRPHMSDNEILSE